jgi:hypothetical protein
MDRCPRCTVKLPANTTVCPNCHSDLSEFMNPPQPPNNHYLAAPPEAVLVTSTISVIAVLLWVISVGCLIGGAVMAYLSYKYTKFSPLPTVFWMVSGLLTAIIFAAIASALNFLKSINLNLMMIREALKYQRRSF